MTDASGGGGAKRLGERLLKEVEVEGLSDVPTTVQRKEKKAGGGGGAVLELISPPPTHHPSGAGKTSLIYLLTALAILPSSLCSIALGGHNAAVILIDPLSHISIPRLASITLSLITRKLQEAGKEPLHPELQTQAKALLKTSLLHVHILRPSSWPSLLATLRTLPEHLFDASRHRSMHRRIHSIVLEDLSSFTSQIRNNTTTTSPTTPNPSQTLLSAASASLTTQLDRLSALLSCAVILTSHSASATHFRPAVPTAWPQGMRVTRLAVRRVEVLKFAPGVSVEDAEAERRQRWEIVARGRFEAWRVGHGAGESEGFVFRVGKGVEIERSEESMRM
ncbi:hypothetical protein BU26DRAFT_484873 [Trematosphaeria pertusa]|uniref:DNA recombination and repair protein Rad51-like C-terminal domain-containing protein n=1 Tax=Trematosphaeria pertusa TaxID=390896 RepID=A0A6A6IGC2_9PLEO|nr:uncharacterized protein BU26DRAFT_484873 [Trematosphaeria pertusa]KAF2249456.1 hypothetical protein BU26DRAFT_484873 [Trematosphaeria pertusa]